MRVVDSGINKIRDLAGDDIDTADWGTSTTTPAASDTSLETEVAGIDQDVTVGKANKTLQLTAVLPSTAGNGNTLSEAGYFFTDGTMFGRVVFVPVAKANNKSLHTISPTVFTSGN